MDAPEQPKIDPAQQTRDRDEAYSLLSRIDWQGSCTRVIDWKRDSDNAVGKFGYFEDATGFVGYLDSWDMLKKVDTEETVRLRKVLAEDMLPKHSMSKDVIIPPRTPWGVPVEITIPLDYLDLNGLRHDAQLRENRRNLTPQHRTATVNDKKL